MCRFEIFGQLLFCFYSINTLVVHVKIASTDMACGHLFGRCPSRQERDTGAYKGALSQLAIDERYGETARICYECQTL